MSRLQAIRHSCHLHTARSAAEELSSHTQTLRQSQPNRRAGPEKNLTELWAKKVLNNHNEVVRITARDVVRKNKLVREVTGIDVQSMNIPIIGVHVEGHDSLSLSAQVAPVATVLQNQVTDLDKKAHGAGTVVVAGKKSNGRTTLAMATPYWLEQRGAHGALHSAWPLIDLQHEGRQDDVSNRSAFQFGGNSCEGS